MKRSLAACSLLLLGSACATAHLSILPRGGTFEPEGDIALSGTAGTAGVNASNSLDALGFVEDDSVPGIRADVCWGVSHWTFAWQQSEHGGTGTLEAEISDEDVVIAAGTQVDTVFDMGLGEFLLTFDVIPSDTVELGIGLGATVFDLDVSVTDPLTGDTVDPDRATLPVPLLALRAGVQFWRVDLQALLGGMDVSYEGDSASLYDLDAFARLNLFGEGSRAHAALIVGYRRLDLDVDYDEDDDSESLEVDIAFDGPYVGLSLGI
jgi:hypothetical protein